MSGRLARAALLVLVVLAIALPSKASAHAALVSSDPSPNSFLRRAPADISVTFSEPIAPGSSTLRLLDSSGTEVPAAALTFSADSHTMRRSVPSLEPGIYNVVWSNVSRVDGHALRGAFPFTVLKPDGTLPSDVNLVGAFGSSSDPAPLADGVAVRALSLLGLTIAAAAAAIVLLWGAGAARIRGQLRLAALGGATVALSAALLHLAIIDREYTGTDLAGLLTGTRVGICWLVRVGAAFLAALAGARLGRRPRAASAAILGAVAVYVWAFAATSHAAAGTGSTIATGIDAVHGAAAVAWIGAVLGVAIAARLSGRGARYRNLMPRFSFAASLLVFVVLASGTLNGLVEVDGRANLTGTRYGATLLVKLALLLPLLAVAGYNARWGRRRLVSGRKGEPRRFILSATAEVALGLAVFFAAAMLTQTTAAKSIVRSGDAGPLDREQPADDMVVALRIDPNRTGLNTFQVALTEAGAPAQADRVRLTFRYQEDQSVGASTLDLSPAYAPGTFVAQGPYLPLEGRWRVEVTIRRPGANDVTTSFDVRPAGTGVIRLRGGGAWANPAPGLSWNEFGGLAALIVGLGVALWRAPLRGLGRWGGLGANLGMAAGFGVGTLLLFGVHRHEATTALPANPIFPDQNSISTGRRLYEQNCVACHGAGGVPPRGLDLNPYPLDLTVHVPQHPDGQLYRFIANGIAATAMRAWSEGSGALTEEEIWHIVNYMRSAFTPVDR